MADFLLPILDFVPEKRPTAARCLVHKWISGSPRIIKLSTAGNDVSHEKEQKVEREAMEHRVGEFEVSGAPKQRVETITSSDVTK